MDCQPVGSDGEQLIDEPKDGVSDIFLGLTPETEAKLKQILLIISLALLGVGILIFIIIGIPKWASNYVKNVNVSFD